MSAECECAMTESSQARCPLHGYKEHLDSTETGVGRIEQPTFEQRQALYATAAMYEEDGPGAADRAFVARWLRAVADCEELP